MFDTVGVIAEYVTKIPKLSGARYRQVIKKARQIFHDIEKQSKRKAYIRSAYFNKEKIFFDYFWEHLSQKSLTDRTRRLRYLPCAIDLIRNSRQTPTSKVDSESRNTFVHRFTRATLTGETFYVQIKENGRTKKKDFISVFPVEEK